MGSGKACSLSLQDATDCVRLLCAVAEIAEPRINWGSRNVRGCYQERKGRFGTICVGPRVRDGIAAVIHEVAHHWDAMRRPRLSRAERRWHAMSGRGSRRIHHGAQFVASLTALAAAWYGDPLLYPWETEYKTVAAGAPRKDQP